MATIDPVELGKWERGETARGKCSRTVLGFYHNLFPKLTGWTLSPAGFIFGSIRIITLLGIGLLPTLLKLFDPSGSMSWPQVVLVSIFIAAALLYNYFYDRIEKWKKISASRRKQRQKISLEVAGIIGELSKILKLRNRDLLPKLENAAGRILACIRNSARTHLGDLDGTHIEATLLLFDDVNCDTIKIASRTTSSRPTGKVRPSCQVMAFYVARSGKHRIIDDFQKDRHPFPRKALSGDKPSYRSILMIPLLDQSSSGPDTCLGVVTLDSSRPFHFWPGNGEQLVIELYPFLFLLAFFVTLNSPHRLKCAGE